MPTRRWMYIAPVSLLCVVAELTIIFGIHFNLVGQFPSVPENLAGKFCVLVALMVGQAGLWGYCGSLTGEWVWQVWSSCRVGPSLRRIPWHYWLALLTRFAFVWIAIGAWYYIDRRFQPGWNLGPYQGRINIQDAGLPGFIVGGLGVSAMWLVELSVYSSRPTDGKVKREQLGCYLDLRQYLNNILTITGIVLALGTLGLNASRDFIKTASPSNFFPHELVIVFGGVFTALLGMSYTPAYLALRTFGSDVRDSIVPPQPIIELESNNEKGRSVESLEQWTEHREKLADLLQLEVRDWKSFGPQVAIVAPLATGLASRLLSGS